MKLNLEVELDWINDEMNLDDTVRENIITAIVDKIHKKVEEQTVKKVEALIDVEIVNKINAMTEALFNDFMNKPVTISDGYGSKLKVYNNVTEIIKERFDNFMTQSVDSKGQTDNSSYGTKYKRVEFIIDQQLKTFADKFTTDAVQKVSAEIKLHVQEGLTNKLGTELMKVLKVDKMLQLK